MSNRISRRQVLESAAKAPVVATLGTGGLLTLLANRQAVAAGAVIPIIGVTTEAGRPVGRAHIHTFQASFRLKDIDTDTGDILGDIVGRTLQTIATEESGDDPHIHPIEMLDVVIGQNINTVFSAFHLHRLRLN